MKKVGKILIFIIWKFDNLSEVNICILSVKALGDKKKGGAWLEGVRITERA